MDYTDSGVFDDPGGLDVLAVCAVGRGLSLFDAWLVLGSLAAI